eukprot:GHVN01014177.1.p2 GENE.GHVN01014177.1~~GHVN01014177.1.p2  ORF type:complete len:126 (-),score=3.26 GHVN01014177.1:49-426(-)
MFSVVLLEEGTAKKVSSQGSNTTNKDRTGQQGQDGTSFPAFWASRVVTSSIDDAADQVQSSGTSADFWVLQTSQQQQHQETGVSRQGVLMSSRHAVEFVVSSILRAVHDGILDVVLFAGAHDIHG